MGFREWGLPKSGLPYDRDCCIFGSILASPYFGNGHVQLLRRSLAIQTNKWQGVSELD